MSDTEVDEEMVPHVFHSRTQYAPGDDRDIWCKDCEYHRDHEIHRVEPQLQKALSGALRDVEVLRQELRDSRDARLARATAERLAQHERAVQQAEAEVESLRALVGQLCEAIKKAKVFIEYVRYELQPGKAVLGDQFPRQTDADMVITKLQQALAGTGGIARPHPPEDADAAVSLDVVQKSASARERVCMSDQPAVPSGAPASENWLYDEHGEVRRELYMQSDAEVDARAAEIDRRGPISHVFRHWVFVDPTKWAITKGTDGWMEVLRADLYAQSLHLLVRGQRGGGFIGLESVSGWATTARSNEQERPWHQPKTQEAPAPTEAAIRPLLERAKALLAREDGLRCRRSPGCPWTHTALDPLCANCEAVEVLRGLASALEASVVPPR